MAKSTVKTTNGSTPPIDPKATKKVVVGKFDYELDSMIDEGIALQAHSEADRYVGFTKIALGATRSRDRLVAEVGLQRDQARQIVAAGIFQKTVAQSPSQREQFVVAGKPTFRKWKKDDSPACRSFLQRWQKMTSIYEACGNLFRQLRIAKVPYQEASSSMNETKAYELFKLWSRRVKAKKLSLRNGSETELCRAILIPLWNLCLPLSSEKIGAMDKPKPKMPSVKPGEDEGDTDTGGSPGSPKLTTFPAMGAVVEAAQAGRYSAAELRFTIAKLQAVLDAMPKGKSKATKVVEKVVEVDEDDDD